MGILYLQTSALESLCHGTSLGYDPAFICFIFIASALECSCHGTSFGYDFVFMCFIFTASSLEFPCHGTSSGCDPAFIFLFAWFSENGSSAETKSGLRNKKIYRRLCREVLNPQLDLLLRDGRSVLQDLRLYNISHRATHFEISQNSLRISTLTKIGRAWRRTQYT